MKIKRDTFEKINSAVELLNSSSLTLGFTGAGISVESGIPPFRGEKGLWNTYDPNLLDLNYFLRNPDHSWEIIKTIFFDFFTSAEPNEAHLTLAKMEKAGKIEAIITQNIDNLHFQAGSKEVIEYHGNSRRVRCMQCGNTYEATEDLLKALPPLCTCGGLLKPDFVFFGEGIPSAAAQKAEDYAIRAEVMLLLGTTGEVYPAAYLPRTAKERGTTIIEINPLPSSYTAAITDIHIPLTAVAAMTEIGKALGV